MQKNFLESVKISRNLNQYQQTPSYKTFNQQGFVNEVSSFPPLISTFQDGKNIWLFKPCDLNRGRGVQVFSKLETLSEIIINMFYNGPENCG